MEILFNDLSVDEQFHDAKTFCEALGCVMKMRGIAKRNGCDDIYYHSSFKATQLINNIPIPKVVNQGFANDKDKERNFMRWLSSKLHWDSQENRLHSEDDWVEHDSTVVTGKALAEAAIRQHKGLDCGLVSLASSNWKHTPLTAIWSNRGKGLSDEIIDVRNWWEPEKLEIALRDSELPLQSWQDLKKRARSKCSRLVFGENCFAQLEESGLPFSRRLAEATLERLKTLDQFAREHNARGQRTDEGNRIYQKHFQGERAWFSDSSDREKNRYLNELTFKSPDGEPVRCSWHGKMSHRGEPVRFHFTWPIRDDGKFFVAYIGPKLTKQ
ncbi:MAG: hypothetical protein ACR2PR_03770 [Pseudohongiellaceae bacterium]